MTTPASNGTPLVAYFSMEIGLEAHIPTYSGGLGVLAGDTIKAAADTALPVVAVSLVHRRGYFRQHLDGSGSQHEEDEPWDPALTLEEMAPRVTVSVQGEPVVIRAWKYVVEGVGGAQVPVFLLDTHLPENREDHQALTDRLYGGDQRYRLAQEIVLGIGGLRLLRALGYHGLRTFHMNEGHSALLTAALLEEALADRDGIDVTAGDVELVRNRCVFTTHTPVPAGHDQFDMGLVHELAGERVARLVEQAGAVLDGTLNMTRLALVTSRYTNAVAMRHGQVTREMFPEFAIHAITNGVHSGTWVAEPFAELFDRHMPGWRMVPFAFRHGIGIPSHEIRRAHEVTKAAMIRLVKDRTGVVLDPGVLTIGFARRAAKYKRPELVFSDLDRLRSIAHHAGPLQFVISGKAHPADEGAKDLIRHVHASARELGDDIKVAYVEDYNMEVAGLLTAGVDLWLNNPQKPMEASGTSGMKAAMNGVPSLSTLDGWWIEGHLEGVTGWSIGSSWEPAGDEQDAEALYAKLEMVVVPMFYRHPDQYWNVCRQAIALNGSFFNAQRMVLQYAREAYRLETATPRNGNGQAKADIP